MAAITNFGELKTEVAAYSHSTTLTAGGDEIAGFVQIAQTHVNNDLRVPEMITTAVLTVPEISSEFATPDDYLAMRSLTGISNDGATRPLKPFGIDEIYRFSASMEPQAFTIWNHELLIRGTPAVGDQFTMIYYKRPDAFVADGDTSDMLTRYTTVYLQASLAELYTWTKDQESADRAAARYDAAVDAFNKRGIEKRHRPTVQPAFNYGNNPTGTY